MIAKVLWRLGVAAAIVTALAAAYFLWFRDSSFVAVDTVRVEGLDGQAMRGERIREELVRTGRQMTTLNVERSRFASAVAAYPEVRAVAVETSFPSTLELTVELHRPVARIDQDEPAYFVAGDGTVLPPGSVLEADVPTMALAEPPERGYLEGPALEQVRVLEAAPAEMLAACESTASSDDSGPVITLRGGIELRFGDDSRPSEKWQAAIAVLTDPALERLDYVDLSSPSRPSVGGEGHSLPPIP